MAIVAAHKASVHSGTNLTSYATGSWTPTANELAICWVQNDLSGTPTIPTVSGNGLTWSQITTYLPDTAGTQRRMTAFAALTGASPSAGAVTADFGGVEQAGCNCIVDQFTGADVSGTALNAIAQSVTGAVDPVAGTSESITLAALAGANNASAGAFYHQANEVTTPGTGYTELGDGSHAGPSTALQSEYLVPGSTTVNASWVTSSQYGGIAIEVKVASSGVTGTGAVTFGSLTASGTGAMLPSGTGAVTFGSLSASGTGAMLPSGTGAVTFAALTVSGSGVQVITGTGAVSFASLTAAGSGAMLPSGTGAVTFAALRAAGYAVRGPGPFYVTGDTPGGTTTSLAPGDTPGGTTTVYAPADTPGSTTVSVSPGDTPIGTTYTYD